MQHAISFPALLRKGKKEKNGKEEKGTGEMSHHNH